MGLTHTLEELLQDYGRLYPITLRGSQQLYVFAIEKDGVDRDQLIKEVEQVIDVVKQCFGIDLNMSISQLGGGWQAVAHLVDQVLNALEFSVYTEDAGLLLIEDYKEGVPFESCTFERQGNQLVRAIRAGNTPNALAAVASVEKALGSVAAGDRAQALESVKTLLMHIFPDVTVDHIHTQEEMVTVLHREVMDRTRAVSHEQVASIGYLVRQATEILKRDFRGPIALKDVADEVGVSTSYLSRMFKKETKQNFVDYLNALRIDEAKALMKDVQLKTYEVAEMVGIQDPPLLLKTL